MGIVMLTVSNSRIRQESAARAIALADEDTALATARQAVDQMLTRVGGEELANVPLVQPIREALLQDALKFYEGFLKQSPSNAAVALEMAHILRWLSTIQRESGRTDEAVQTQRRNLELLQSLVASDPSEPTSREQLADAYRYLAFTIYFPDSKTNDKEAEALLRESLRLYADLEHDFPDVCSSSPQACHIWAAFCRDRGDRVEAERLFRAAIARQESYLQRSPDEASWTQLCWMRFVLAGLQEKSEPTKAEDSYREAKDAAETALQMNPTSKAAGFRIAETFMRLGKLYRVTHRTDEAVRLLHNR